MQSIRNMAVLAVLCFGCFLVRAQENPGRDLTPANRTASVVSIAELPLAFEPNVGQGPSDQIFLTRSGIMQMGFSADSLDFRLPSTSENGSLGMTLVGANKNVKIEASEKGVGESNYILGNQQSAWKTHIPQYGRITYKEIYSGVDLTYYGTGGRMEHDFVVQPGADYRQIKMRYTGARTLALSANGDLRMGIGESEVTVRAPHIFQRMHGREQEIDGTFVLFGDDEVGFSIGAFDPSLPLVIDPVLDYATYLANLSLYIQGVAVDAAGNTYITGQSFYSSYPVTTGAYQTTCTACASNYPDVFITKLNATGTAQVYSTFLGGSNYNVATMIAVDASGDAIVTGYTQSSDFPLKNPISSGTLTYPVEAGFVTSLAPDGASLNFSSILGGTDSQGVHGDTYPGAIAVDASGNVYVAGTTESDTLPVTSGALNAGVPSYFNGYYVFLTKLQPSGNLVYSAIVGATGSASDCCSVVGLAVDSAGNAYLGGNVGGNPLGSSTTPWPTTAGAYQTALIPPAEGAPFAAKVSADGTTLLYSTLVATGTATGMALTSDNQVILVGTANYNYPVTSNAYSSTVGTSFIAKLSADATQLAYSSYFSTPAGDTGGDITSVALDATGNVWLVGATVNQDNIPMVDPLQSVPAGQLRAAFVTEFDPTIRQILFSTYFNGVLNNYAIDGLAIDNQGRAHIVGIAATDLPTTSSSYLSTVTAAPSGQSYSYGFAALIDPSQPGPATCFSNATYGTAQVGTSGQSSFTITNCGNAPLIISNTQISSAVFSLPSSTNCIGTLAAGTSCNLTATFTPTAAGYASAVVTITSNAPFPTNDITIYGLGTAPSIFILQTNIVFPTQVYGISASATNVGVMVANEGTAPLNVYPALTTITGDFNIVSNNCSSPLPPNYACIFTLAFSPTQLGTRTGTFTIASNDLVHPSYPISLSGTSVANFTTPTINYLSVPSVALGSSAFALTIYGTNFFPESYVTIGGELPATTFEGSSALKVTVDPTLLTVMGELPVTVVNPAPGGQSNSVPLVVFQALPISAASLVYNATTGMLYASIPSSATANANTVLPINPLTGATGTPIPVGNNPGKLAVSSDGAYLFVGLNGDHTLQRINLSTSQVERTFALPIDSLWGIATTVYDMHGVPGSPQSVVVSLSMTASPSEAGAALYTDAGLVSFLGSTFQNSDYGIDSFAFTSNPSILYAYPFGASFFSETGVSATALTIISGAYAGSCCNQATGSMVASDGTLLYTNSGEVWNPANTSLLGTYSPTSGTLFYEQSVVPDTANNRTFILDRNFGYNNISGYADILSFNQASYAQAGSVSVPVQNYVEISDLNRWGVDGFAFHSTSGTSSDEIVILRSSIAHTANGGTPSLLSLQPASAPVGTATSQITVNGSGFTPETKVLWSGIALETTYVSATQLTVLAPGSEFASEGIAQITAVNPAPGGSSSALTFSILGPQVTLTSTNVAFGVVQAATVSPVTQISVQNTGTGALTGLVIAITGTNASSFKENSLCGSTLAAGASCTVNLTFAPSASGLQQAALTLTDNAPNTPQTVSLSGTGETLTVTVTPSSPSITTAQALSVTAAVSGGSGNPTPTGSVMLTSGSYTSTAATLTSGSATINISAGLLAVGTDTLTVSYTPDLSSSSIYSSANGTALLTVNNPVPVIAGISPAFTNAGGAAFPLTVTGSGFTSGSTVYWGTSALTTTNGNATQLTVQVPATGIATEGTTVAVTVQTPTPGGGTSNPFQFEVNSSSGSTTGPTFTSTSATVTAGSPASYPVTLPSTVESASVTCLNLPTGAACSYSATTNTLTITTSSTTPKGTYQITVVFTETVSGAATSWILLPILLLPLVYLRRKLAARGVWITASLGLILLAAAAYTAGCGGGGSSSTYTPPPTHQVISSGSVGITIQ